MEPEDIMSTRNKKPNFKRISEIISMLGNINRLQIVKIILSEEACPVSHLNDQFEYNAVSVLSRNLSKLKMAKIISSKSSGRQKVYSIYNEQMKNYLLRVLGE